MREVLTGVFAVGPTAVAMETADLTTDAWLTACVLRGGDGAALSHAAAAARLGGWKRWDGSVSVTSPRRITCVTLGVPRRYARAEAGQTIDVRGVPVTTPERTVLDLGTELTAHQICHVIHELTFLRVLDLRLLEDALEQRRGGRGTAVVRKALRLYRAGSAGTRSFSEDHLLEGVHRTRRIGEPIVNNRNAVDIHGIEPDFAWPDARLIVEVDGASGHDQPGKRAHDRQRDAALAAQGWLVIRFDAQRVRRDRAAVIREIERAYARRVVKSFR